MTFDPAAGVPAPQLRAGDAWRFRVDDRLRGRRSEETRRVVQLLDDRIVCENDSTDPAYARGRYVYTREWNLLERPALAAAGDSAEEAGRWVWDPHYPQFRFPLHSGARWSGRATVSNAATDTRNVHAYSVQVRPPETVAVPAGRFDTLPVRYEAHVASDDGLAQLAWFNVERLYYAPAVNLFVQLEHTIAGPDGQRARDSLHVLLEYRRA
jgi:hypothetical protein